MRSQLQLPVITRETLTRFASVGLVSKNTFNVVCQTLDQPDVVSGYCLVPQLKMRVVDGLKVKSSFLFLIIISIFRLPFTFAMMSEPQLQTQDQH